jgi:hypothetical protein
MFYCHRFQTIRPARAAQVSLVGRHAVRRRGGPRRVAVARARPPPLAVRRSPQLEQLDGATRRGQVRRRQPGQARVPRRRGQRSVRPRLRQEDAGRGRRRWNERWR